VNVIVVGCGRVGSQLATLLSVDGHNVTVIDKESSSFRRLGTTFNGVTIRGLGFDEDVLEEAGIRECDAFAAVTDLDNTNLMAAEVARKIFEVPHVVARLYNPQRERTYQQLDLDYVCGTTLVAESLLDKIQSGHGHHIDTFGDVEIVVFKLAADSFGKSVRDLDVPGQIMVAIIARGKRTFIPTPDTVLEAGDVLRVAMKADAMPQLRRHMEA
jgi:trk system potassium uptake protein TrkA